MKLQSAVPDDISRLQGDNDTYVERDTLLEEAVMVAADTQTITVTRGPTRDARDARDVTRDARDTVPRHSVTRVLVPDTGSYDQVPLPPSPRPVSKYRSESAYNQHSRPGNRLSLN